MTAHPHLPIDSASRIGTSSHDRVGLVACVAAGLFVIALSWTKLGSIDLGYHLAYGRHFLATGQIVEVDPFLYPENAKRFINANWGSQIIMALVEQAAGAAGLFALCLGLIVAIFAAMAWIVWGQTKSALAVAVAWLLAALAGYERFSLRPELFSYACMMLILVVLVRGIQSWRGVAAIAMVQLAWVNLHSYFLVGVLITGCWLVGDAARWLSSKKRRTDAVGDVRRQGRWLIVALAVQVAMCFANPWLHRGAIFPIATLEYLRRGQVMGGGEGWSGESAWSIISEFKSPFSFLDEPSSARTIHAYLLLLPVAVVGAVALAAQGRLGAACAVLLLVVMSTQMRRNIAQLALVASPLAAMAFSTGAAKLGQWPAGRRLRDVFAIVVIGLLLWWTYGIVAGRFYYDERRLTRQLGTGYSGRVFPIDAVQWLAAQSSLQPNLYVNYFASSSTLPWLPERFKLFADTNTFAYEEQVLATAHRLGMGEIDPAPIFEEHRVNVVLLLCGPDTQMLIRRLAVDGNWALVYFDRHAVVFARRMAEHAGLIASSQRSERDLDAGAWIASIGESGSQRALELGLAAGVPLSLGWHGAAIELAKEAVRIAPDYYEGWQYLGVSHGNRGNLAGREGRYGDSQREYTEALMCFNRVLALKPDHTEARIHRDRTLQVLELLKAEGAP
jgi:tetratricopeptide (TPR) repeat protein